MRTPSTLLALATLAFGTPASAQFFTPLPAPVASRVVQKEDYAYGLYGSLDREALALQGLLADRPTLQKAIDDYCATRTELHRADCAAVLNADTLIAHGAIVPVTDNVAHKEKYARGFLKSLNRESLAVKALLSNPSRTQAAITRFCETKQELQKDCTTVLIADSLIAHGAILPVAYRSHALPFAWPFAKRAERNHEVLQQYLNASHAATDLSVLNQFAANLSDKTAYVTTDIISGATLGTLLSIQYAAVVVKDSNQAPDRRHPIEDNTATALRMINNGGTVTARILYPFWSSGGTNIQQAVSLYGTVGVIGPTGHTDSLRFASSVILELMNGIAIRALGAGADVNGELVIGVRGGFGFSEDELIPNSGRSTLPFGQLGIGLRQGGTLGLSLLYTYLGNNTVFRPYYPKFLVNFTALR
jgi:hypothetical protein